MLVDLVDTAELHGAAASVNQRPWLESGGTAPLPAPAGTWRAEVVAPAGTAETMAITTPASSATTHANFLVVDFCTQADMVLSSEYGWSAIRLDQISFANPRIPRELRESGYWPGSLTGFGTRMRHYPAGDHSLVRQR